MVKHKGKSQVKNKQLFLGSGGKIDINMDSEYFSRENWFKRKKL